MSARHPGSSFPVHQPWEAVSHQPMTIFPPPSLGPPLFVAHKKLESGCWHYPSDVCQGIDVCITKGLSYVRPLWGSTGWFAFGFFLLSLLNLFQFHVYFQFLDLNASIYNLWLHSEAKYLIFAGACNIAKSTDVLILCKLLIHIYLIIIFQCLSPYIVVLLHSILLYRVLLYRVLLPSHSLWIKNKLHHQNISKPKVLSLLSTAVGLVHEPSLPKGGGKPATNQIWHPMWGLWPVDRTHPLPVWCRAAPWHY